MENNRLHIDEYFDAWQVGKISKEELTQSLLSAGVENVEAEIQLHQQSVFLIQQLAINDQIKEAEKAYRSGDYASKKESTNHTRILKLPYWVWTVAASVILFISGSIFYLNEISSSDKLAQSISQEYLTAVLRSGELDKDLSVPFLEKDFDAVIDIFEKGGINNQREYFLTGYAYLQSGQINEAISLLKTVINLNEGSREKLYQDDAEFYLLSAYLKSDRVSEAKILAQKIRKDKFHTYYNEITFWFLFKLNWLNEKSR
jgi:tetratricopeptide (TPR) repeat protein